MDDHRKQTKGTSSDDGVVANRWRLDSCGGVRGTVDALVTPADMEKAGCCGSLAYGPMAKMEAADAGSSRDRMLWVTRARRGWDLAGAAKGRTVIGTVDWAGWGAGV
jgi:hypothetical protein